MTIIKIIGALIFALAVMIIYAGWKYTSDKKEYMNGVYVMILLFVLAVGGAYLMQSDATIQIVPASVGPTL